MKHSHHFSLFIAAAVFVSSLGGAALCAQRASSLCESAGRPLAQVHATVVEPVSTSIQPAPMLQEFILEETKSATVFQARFVVQ